MRPVITINFKVSGKMGDTAVLFIKNKASHFYYIGNNQFIPSTILPFSPAPESSINNYYQEWLNTIRQNPYLFYAVLYDDIKSCRDKEELKKCVDLYFEKSDSNLCALVNCYTGLVIDIKR